MSETPEKKEEEYGAGFVCFLLFVVIFFGIGLVHVASLGAEPMMSILLEIIAPPAKTPSVKKNVDTSLLRAEIRHCAYEDKQYGLATSTKEKLKQLEKKGEPFTLRDSDVSKVLVSVDRPTYSELVDCLNGLSE